ncbi:MAG: EamA family transporter [Acidobacteria bacterium]|nr:EamA family transporter [Acidobacteriota bacterium]
MEAKSDSAAKPGSAWVLYSMICILWWGVWGFLSKLGSDRVSPEQLQILFTLGIIPPSILAWAQLGFKVETDRRGMIYGISNGVLSGLGMLAFYAALARGKASIIGPFTALFPLLTVALAFAFLRERINRIQAAGMVLALAAILILAY